MKGTDASWVGDSEVPPEFQDFSDDESEFYSRPGATERLPTNHQVKRTHSGDSHKKFENTMNKRNLLNTRFNKYMDKQTKLIKTKQRRPTAASTNTSTAAPQISSALLAFDPTVPPPNMRPYCMSFNSGGGAAGVGGPQSGHLQTQENNNGVAPRGFSPNLFMNNFVANLSHHQTNSANYFTNTAGYGHPGPSSHQ